MALISIIENGNREIILAKPDWKRCGQFFVYSVPGNVDPWNRILKMGSFLDFPRFALIHQHYNHHNRKLKIVYFFKVFQKIYETKNNVNNLGSSKKRSTVLDSIDIRGQESQVKGTVKSLANELH